MQPSTRPPPPSTLEVPPDGFVPEHDLAMACGRGVAVRTGAVLSLRDGRRFALEAAVRVLGRYDGETDPFGLTGAIEPIASLLRRGFVIGAERVALGKLVYDVVCGAVLHPFGSPDESGPWPGGR